MSKEKKQPETQNPQTEPLLTPEALDFPTDLINELLTGLEKPLHSAAATVAPEPLAAEPASAQQPAQTDAAQPVEPVPAEQAPSAPTEDPSAAESQGKPEQAAAAADQQAPDESGDSQAADQADAPDENPDSGENGENIPTLVEAALDAPEQTQEDPLADLPLVERARQRARMRRREQTRMRRESRKRGGAAAETIYQPATAADMRLTLIRLGLAALLLVAGLLLQNASDTAGFIFYLLAYLITAIPVVLTAVREMTHGHYFNEYLLVFLASLGAFLLQRQSEASFVLILHSVGKLISDAVLMRTRASLSEQTDYLPEQASLVNMQGEEKRVMPQDIQPGDFVLVRTGERIPVDGEVLRGEGTVDDTVLTGDSDSVPVVKGGKVLAGSLYEGTLLLLRATARFEDCAASQIKRVSEEAAGRRSKLEETVVHSFTRWMPILFVLALLLSFLPPLFNFGRVSVWLYRALTVLIVCCPTALIISVPLSFMGGNGRLSQKGIQVKGNQAIEKLAELRMVVFGKTGTLTRGSLRVKEIHATGDFNEESCLALAATAEQLSHHPVARAVVAAYEGIPQKISEFEEFPGRGVRVRIGKHNLLVGNRKLMISRGVKGVPDIAGTVLYIAYEGDYAGAVVLEDTVRPEAADAIAGLKAQGVLRTVILTGDTELPAQQTATAIGIDTVHSGLTPEEKASKMEFLLRTIPTDGTAAYVGDGVNDIAELGLADVGVAMGAAGSKQSADAASVLIMSNDLGRLTDAVRISRLTHSVAMQDMIALLLVKLILIVLTLFGVATMWQAVAVDVLMTVLTVLNAARVLKAK